MKKWLGRIFGFIIIALLVFFIVKDINFQEIYFYLTFLSPAYFLLAFFCHFLTFVLWAFRWEYFFQKVFRVEFLFLLKVLFAGAFFNTITPGAGIGGEPFKAYLLSKRYKKSKNKVLGMVLADKFFHLMVFAFFIIFSIFFVLIYLNIPDNLKLILEIVLISVMLVIGLTVFFILRKLDFKVSVLLKGAYIFKFIKRRFKTLKDFENYVNKKAREFSRIFRKIVKNKKNIFLGIFLSLCFWLLQFAVSYFLFVAFGVPVNFLSIIIVVALGILIGALSFLPGGVGVVEGSMVLLYSAMGINFSVALLVAFLSRIIFYFFALVVGGLSLVHLRAILNGKNNFL